MKSPVKKDSHLPRKAFHALAGSIIPTVYYMDLFPGSWVTAVTAFFTVIWISFEAARLKRPGLNGFFRQRFGFLMKTREARSPTGVAYMLAGSTLALLLFSQPVAVAVLYFIALGDPAAAVVGKAVGRVRIYRARTLEGSAVMFVVCLALGRFFADISWSAAAVGALVAALAELYSGQIDDNLTVPVLSGAAIMSLG